MSEYKIFIKFLFFNIHKMAPIQRGEGQREREKKGVTGQYRKGKDNKVGKEEN